MSLIKYNIIQLRTLCCKFNSIKYQGPSQCLTIKYQYIFTKSGLFAYAHQEKPKTHAWCDDSTAHRTKNIIKKTKKKKNLNNSMDKRVALDIFFFSFTAFVVVEL